MTIMDKCCGCSACTLVCPENAIKMRLNDNGFYEPIVDENKCINCNLCKKVCKEKETKIHTVGSKGNYVAVVKNKEVLEKSSSGGIGHALAQKAITLGYRICGVQYNIRAQRAEHILIKENIELYKIQGSKYLQSFNEMAFREVIKSNHKTVIFGTPCQVAGIDYVLKKNKIRDNYILVDIFCHGVPSTLLWQRHLQYLKRIYKIDVNIEPVFRQKKDYRLTVGKYNKWYNQDAWYLLFLKSLMMNKSCYECPYRRMAASDIRIGDLLTSKYRKLAYSPSCICINTEKGNELLNSCEELIEKYAIKFDEIDRIQEKESKKMPDNYDENFRKLREEDAYPEMIMGKEMCMYRIKAFIKIKITMLNKCNEKSELYQCVQIKDGKIK